MSIPPWIWICTFFMICQLASVISQWTQLHSFSGGGKPPYERSGYRLSKPLIGGDGRVYACSERNVFAFQSNGSIAWTLPLNYTCNYDVAPIHGGTEKIYLIAENRILRVSFPRIGKVESGVEEILLVSGEIVGISVSTLASSLFINIKNSGLFAYTLRGKQLLWSVEPFHYRSGYRQGCTKDITDCYFTSVPVIDRCEASIYISNSGGELYSVSAHGPYYKWIKDLSSFDKKYMVTAGNNGRLYVTVPSRAILLALDVTTGDVLWQGSIGPLSTPECTPVVDSNGWVSIGSLDGSLYSFSPNGVLKKYSRKATVNSVIQVSPIVDCSGYGVYICLTQMDGKSSLTIGDHSYVYAMKPNNAEFTMLVPATGSIYWQETYSTTAGGWFASLIFDTDLQHFIVDERTLLAFLTASKTGNPLSCRSRAQKLAYSCSQAKPKYLSLYTGNERAIVLFLLFESVLLIALAGLVRFCCIFWSKKKIQGKHLGNFLEKRRWLQLKKKEYSTTIAELEKKVTEEEAVDNNNNQAMLDNLGDVVREKQGIERKLSTTYSLGRDTASKSRSLLPLQSSSNSGILRRRGSYSFQSRKKETSVTIFHTLSDTDTNTDTDSDTAIAIGASFADEEVDKEESAKTKAENTCSSDGNDGDDDDDNDSVSTPVVASTSKGWIENPLFVEDR